MEQLLERLKNIKNEVQSLKTINDDLKQSLDTKEKEINRLKQLLEIQNSSLKEMEQKLKIKRIAEGAVGESDGESSRDLKFKINEMLKEVEKVMSLMHQ